MYRDRTKRKKGLLGLIGSLASTLANVGMWGYNQVQATRKADEQQRFNTLSTNLNNNIKANQNAFNLYNSNDANTQSLEEKVSLHDNIYSRLGTKVSKGGNVNSKQFDRMRLQQQYACGGKYHRK